MAGRAVANSTLQVGLLSIPVALHKISDPKEVKFDRASDTGAALTRTEVAEVVDTKTGVVTEQKVAPTEIQYGVRDENDKFHPISAEAIKEAEALTKLDIFEVSAFVHLKDLPRSRAKSSYYLTPQGKAGPGGAKPMGLLHAILSKSKKAGVTKICLTKRQYLAVVFAEGDGLFIQVMEWAEDWAEADRANIFAGVKVDKAMMDVGMQLVDQLTVPDAIAALDAQQDDLRVARAKLRDDALANRPFKAKAKKAEAPAPDGMMAALEASIAAAAAKPKATA